MKTEELCEYIKHYLEEDKTRSAIMLNGEWGTGKSYFIENTLVPFLENGEKPHKCIVVSLYGLRDVGEISKAIYFDLRIKSIKRKSEAYSTGAVIANTIFKGIAGHYGFDLSEDNKKLRKLYESIDLSQKLIVLEDLERTGIPLLTLLGYVNNMVEHDGTKVLLVANESAIIAREQSKQVPDQDEKHDVLLAESQSEYQRIKEKTVSDTVQFECNLDEAIKNIIGEYGESLKSFDSPEAIADIKDIMFLKNSFNLRAFLFACQKTSDIFSYMSKHTYSPEFKTAIFYGLIAFSLKLKQNRVLPWQGDQYLSMTYGVSYYPLFKFCYDYVIFQTIDEDGMDLAQTAFINMLRYDANKSRNDPDILTLKNYYIKTEKEVRSALQRIEGRLLDPDDISYYEYGDLIIYSLRLREVLGVPIETIKNRIIKNLKGKAKAINQDELFRIAIDPDDSELNKEFKEIKAQMIVSLNEGDDTLLGWDYLPQNAKSIYNYLIQHKGTYSYNGRFILSINPSKFAKMFLASNSEQMFDIRGIILAFYPIDSIGNPSVEEQNVLSKIKTSIEAGRLEAKLDAIQNMHCNFLLENLEIILSR